MGSHHSHSPRGGEVRLAIHRVMVPPPGQVGSSGGPAPAWTRLVWGATPRCSLPEVPCIRHSGKHPGAGRAYVRTKRNATDVYRLG